MQNCFKKSLHDQITDLQNFLLLGRLFNHESKVIHPIIPPGDAPCCPHLQMRGNLSIDNLGIQLYSLRKPLNENLRVNHRRGQNIGYKQVEPYDFPSSKSLEMISKARDHGMQVNSSHFQWDSLLNLKR